MRLRGQNPNERQQRSISILLHSHLHVAPFIACSESVDMTPMLVDPVHDLETYAYLE